MCAPWKAAHHIVGAKQTAAVDSDAHGRVELVELQRPFPHAARSQRQGKWHNRANVLAGGSISALSANDGAVYSPGSYVLSCASQLRAKKRPAITSVPG